MSSIGLVFFLARACQHKTHKTRITILALPQLKLCILQDRNYLKTLKQPNLFPLEKYPKQQVSYLYQIVHLIKNPTKFGSSHLDTPSSRYKFLKFVFKSVKINTQKHFQNPKYTAYTWFIHPTATDSRAPQSTQPHLTDTQSRARWLTGHCLSTARSPVARSPALCSPHSYAPTCTLGWLG